MIHRDNWPTQYHNSVHPSCHCYTTPNFYDQIFHYHLKKLSKVTPKDFDEPIKNFNVCVHACVLAFVCGAWSSWGLLMSLLPYSGLFTCGVIFVDSFNLP